MIERAEAVTNTMLRLALDAASLNHQAIANNIANVNTPGYAPVRVNFETQMAIIRQRLAEGEAVTSDTLTHLKPVLERLGALSDSDRTAMLDMEAAKLAENTVHYEALLKVVGLRNAIFSTAINEGKR